MRGGLGELVALALDEVVEGEFGIDARADHQAWPRAVAAASAARRPSGRRCRRGPAGRPARVPTSSTRSGTSPSANARSSSRMRGSEILAQPVDDVAIGRQQPQLAVALDRLQRPHPGVELLLRELALEHTQTAIP